MKNLIIALVCISICSCTPHLDYLGDSYAPTQKVDIFFDENDIEKDFKVMGIVKNEGRPLDLDDTESMQKAMIAKAKSLGADAVLFVDLYTKEQRGEHTEIIRRLIKETKTILLLILIVTL